MNGKQVGHWQQVLDTALAMDDQRRMADIIIGADQLLAPAWINRVDMLPHGRPTPAQVLKAGHALVERLDGIPADQRWAWQAIAVPAASHFNRRAPGEAATRIKDHLAALQRSHNAIQGRDTVLELWLLYRISMRQRDDLQLADSWATAMAMLDLLQTRGPVEHTVLVGLVSVPTSVRSASEYVRRFRVAAHARASYAARFQRDYARAIDQMDHALTAAGGLSDLMPNLLVMLLGERAALARDIGDAAGSTHFLDKQRAEVEALDWWWTTQMERGSRAKEALFFGDHDAALAAQNERVVVYLRGHGFNTREPAMASDGMRAVTQARAEGQLGRLGVALGNRAFDMALGLLDSGRCATDQAARDEARAWLDVADEAWEDEGFNGPIAIEFRRLELAVIEGSAPSPMEVGREMVRLSREWRRVIGQRRAALAASIHGAAGDTVVLDRLVELRTGAPEVDGAYLDIGIARWHYRRGDQARDLGDLPLARSEWRNAAELAGQAAAQLRVVHRVAEREQDHPPTVTYLSPPHFIAACVVQADALSRLRTEGGAEGGDYAERELAVRVAMLPSLARQLAAALTPQQLQSTAAEVMPRLITAVELAIALQNPQAVDLIMEVARRDEVGAILSAMSNDPGTGDLIRDAARGLSTALRAAVQSDPSTHDASAGLQDQAPEPGMRALEIEDSLSERLMVFENVVGPVARALIDPTNLSGATAERLLSRPRGPQVVLSLWLHDDHLVRHLAWLDEETVQHRMDRVAAPAWLARFSIGEAEPFMEALDRWAPVLLPPELLGSFDDRFDSDHPMDLTIVPTGLFGIPFAGLPVGPRQLLIDVATITLVQSLTAAVELAAGDFTTESLGDTIATYDTTRLTHTVAEYADLTTHRSPIRQVESLEQLRTEMTTGQASMFVLALHGVRGRDGWSQVKVMPNGEELLTSHVLEWHVPVLVVAASCDTDMRADGEGRLGGFPLAFQMRGAKLVVGTLARVDDKATAEIMGLFYAALAAGIAPSAALRSAQRTWARSGDPHQRLARRTLWALHVAYGYAFPHPAQTGPEQPSVGER